MITLTELNESSNLTTNGGTLHIINKSPSENSLYEDCFNALLDNDALLFIESAVYACQDSNLTLPDKKADYFILQADINARGIAPLIENHPIFTCITDDQFVSLCCKYKKTLSWF